MPREVVEMNVDNLPQTSSITTIYEDDRMMTLSKEEKIPDRMMDLSKEELVLLSGREGWSYRKIAKEFNLRYPYSAITFRKCELTTSEKRVITSELATGKSTLQISKIIGRCHQFVNTFVKFESFSVPNIVPAGANHGLKLTRQCKNEPNRFCYICEELTFAKEKRSVIQGILRLLLRKPG
ncbi:Hypothetical predicted protein [Octopus vulgaris]|uniref:Uncharacterized protein n=1 Tax=Octopus vulgaris TaxID=6645 RepID=A0AA36B1T1_OCTVU|nr:Hypothetical predicted protein [Octopus vulgaris]